MHEYKIEVTRDDRWWLIHVPEIGHYTQARRISEIDDMARSLIHISTDIPLLEIGVRVVSIGIDGMDALLEAGHVRHLREQAAKAEQTALAAAADFARHLAKADIPVRDIAALLGVSPQRVSQLANAK
jgi:hypothetical protein